MRSGKSQGLQEPCVGLVPRGKITQVLLRQMHGQNHYKKLQLKKIKEMEDEQRQDSLRTSQHEGFDSRIFWHMKFQKFQYDQELSTSLFQNQLNLRQWQSLIMQEQCNVLHLFHHQHEIQFSITNGIELPLQQYLLRLIQRSPVT